MSEIKFTKQEKDEMVLKLQTYFGNELSQELGQFDAEFLLDFVSKELGAYYYNRGLHDAREVFENRVQAIDDDLYAIEKETR
ncbi:DUF2164 family protein [Alteromonas sp. 345S023]|uniref:DUF2164 family protein n=1 Tax=Alteromonas profundi TaxID=2696062 RepID=A0A7X5RMR9_9ALTE|nr:DUF2164 domain-containing protein [Alteromonas profundi]NDV93044.1 DUF2164 family protein [Alteromonas profundi]